MITTASFYGRSTDSLVCVCVAVTSHLVPVCVTPPPPLHLSLLRCPSFKSTFFIATLLISSLFACVCVCVCAGIPKAGVNQAGSVGGGCRGEDSFLPEGDRSPAEAAERKTGGWGKTAAVQTVGGVWGEERERGERGEEDSEIMYEWEERDVMRWKTTVCECLQTNLCACYTSDLAH